MVTKAIVLIIRLYQVLFSPLLGSNCRFTPTCSCYATQALIKHGLGKGSILIFLRLLKCHPWHAGGDDAVPERIDNLGKLLKTNREHKL